MTTGEQEKPKKQTAKDRRAICARCPQQSKSLIKECALCGCLIVTLTLTAGQCRLNKW